MPLNPNLQSFSTEVLVQELIERRQLAVDRLEAAISLWSDAHGAPARVTREAPGATSHAMPAPAKSSSGLKAATPKTPAGKSATRSAKPAAKADAPRPRGRRPAEGEKRSIDYALEALRAAGRPMSIREITEAAKAAGWKTTSDEPAKVLGVVLHPLAKARKIVRMKDRGVYELVGG